LIILGFLIAVIGVVSTLIILFLENERFMLHDQRLGAIASTLIASGLSLDLIQNLESTDDLIHDLLGEEKIDQIINIYSLDGKILAQNYTAVEIPIRFEANEQWQTYKIKDRTVRVLNLRRGNLIVQVGVLLSMVMDLQNLVNVRLLVFFIIIGLIVLLTSYFGSEVLFNPLKKLTREFEVMAVQLDRKIGQPLGEFVIGPEISRLSKVSNEQALRSKDEFELLCVSIESFLKKLEDYTRSFNAQTAILTHELKTPLAVIRGGMDRIQHSKNLQQIQGIADTVMSDIDELAQLINSFLQWSVLTSNPGQGEIFAIRPSEVLKKILHELNSDPQYRGRIHLEIGYDEVIFALPSHIQQLLINLIVNALNYSPQSQKVDIFLRDSKLCIVDRGPGIPADVIRDIGKPFNRGPDSNRTSRSSGLGLAWVHSLCKKYGWKLNISTSPTGTQININFNEHFAPN